MSEEKTTESKDVNEITVMNAVGRWLDKLEPMARVRVSKYFSMKAEQEARPAASDPRQESIF